MPRCPWLISILSLAAGCGHAVPDLRDADTYPKLQGKKALVVVTSHERFGTTDKKTGYWLEEVSHFYYRLEQAGLEVDIASPKGGTPPMDPRSEDPNDDINAAFSDNARARRKLTSTLRPDQTVADAYAVVYFAGGHGAMWDFPTDQRLATLAARVYEKGWVVAAVCHGPAALLGITLSDGQPLIAGKKVTGFTNEEEGVLLLRSDVPFLLEDLLEKKSGGNFVQSIVPFTSHAVVSERVVTGQNPMSTDATALAVIQTLERLGRK